MSNITRSEAIDVIELIMRKYEEDECVCCDIMLGDEEYEALRFVRDYLKTDEAYQLEYEETTKNDLGVDCINRDSAIKALDYDIESFEFKSGVSKYMDDIAKLLNTIYEIQVNNIKALSSVTPQDIDYKAQYERLSQKAEIVISQLRADRDRLIRPKGHWICDGKGRSFADYHCSECGLKLALCGQDIKQRQDSGYSLFCGGCGADMREVVEE